MRFLFCILLTTVTAHAAIEWKLEERQTVAKSFNVTGNGSGGPKILVDNINGSIHVTGYSGSEAKMTAVMRYRAESAEAMAEAKRDVKLDMNQQGNFARIYLDGPFRNRRDEWRGDRYYGYSVDVDFEIQVPLATETILKTVNGGEITLKNTSGDFDIRNVNGLITMEGMFGSGSVNTVNGPVTARFARNPARASSFKTVNGKVEVQLQQPLSADFRFKTMNGQIYTDFDVAPLPQPAGTVEQRNGKFIYKSNRMTFGRTGKGGPEFTFDTLNGDIRLRTKPETR